MCRKPYQAGLEAYGCGQCGPCRANRKRVWTHRLMLEATQHERCCFVTLTYNEEFVPEEGVSVAEMQSFIKRLRSAHKLPIRHFYVGEYGDETWRPHYHLVLFGVGVEDTEVIEKCWKKGFVQVVMLSRELAQYCCGYVSKKLTRKEHPSLKGRNPEFARMSLRPGIGAGAMESVASALSTAHGVKAISLSGDVPTVLSHGRKKLPLGRYLRRRLRGELGFEEVGGQAGAKLRSVEEMRELYEKAGPLGSSIEKPYVEYQRMASLEARLKIFAKKGRL